MSALGDVASALVSTDPADQAGRVLGRLLDHFDGSGGALIVPGEHAPRVFVARNIGLLGLESLPALWHRHERALTMGRAAGREGQRLLPLVEEGKLIGALYLESSGPLNVDRLAPYLTVLSRAVIVALDPNVRRSLGEDLLGVGPERTKREITLASLRQHEWNISRVARELGLTRRTIYLRLTRWGIVRERVPKTARKLYVEEA